MRDQEIVGLWEAYMQVHQLQEEVEQLGESGLPQDTIQRAVKERQKRVDVALAKDTPEGDAEGKAGMKKLRRSKRQLHINKPREVKMRANEEIETWVNSLIEEGYDLSEYTWDDMCEMYMNLDEGNRGENETGMSNVSKLRRRQKKFAAGIVHPDEAGELEGERQKAHRSGRYVPTRGSGVREGYDTFDAILEHLVVEGYADTNEAALAIMANMSEEWREEILDEAITSEKGKAKAAEMIAARSTPSGRAKSGKGANVAQIRNIGRSNREGLGGTPMTPTMAKNPVKKKNYDGTGNRAARRSGKEVEDTRG